MVKEINTEKFTVRIHEGKLTEAERKEVLKNASERFFRSVQHHLGDDFPDCNGWELGNLGCCPDPDMGDERSA